MNSQAKYNLLVSENDKSLRLDKFLCEKIENLSRSQIQSLIRDGHVTKQGSIIDDRSYRVKLDEEFEVVLPEAKPTQMKAASDISLDIRYEDDEFLVINKQAGLTVHPGAGNYDDTLANALLAHCKDSLSGIGGFMRPGIVHRLDKDTSGLMVAAKTDIAHRNLSEQIACRSLKRVYTAICWGVPKPHKGVIVGNIARSQKNRIKMAVVKSGGKEATTHYEVKEILAEGAVSVVECKLETGRTHQIRVHMTEYGFPLIGDPVYGRKHHKIEKKFSTQLQEAIKNFDRQALHSSFLGVEHPLNNDYMEFRAQLPEDMKRLLDIFRLEKLEL